MVPVPRRTIALALLGLAACGESTRPPTLIGTYAMVSYGGQALPAETGRRAKIDLGSGSTTTCADTVRSAAIVLQEAGAARWQWSAQTSCADGGGPQETLLDLQASYALNAEGTLVVAVYPLTSGPTIPQEPGVPLEYALRRDGADALVFESDLGLGDPFAAPGVPPEEEPFRIVWRRAR